MTIGRSQRQYGRIVVGQRVLYERLELAPTNEPPSWANSDTVTLRTRHQVTDIRPCDSGALVTLTDGDGHELKTCFNSYGQSWGGYGGLTVEADAPYQSELRA